MLLFTKYDYIFDELNDDVIIGGNEDIITGLNQEIEKYPFPTNKRYKNNKMAIKEHNPVDQVLMKPVVTECSIIVDNVKQCMTDETADKVKETLKVKSLDEAKEKLQCETERCILEKLKIAPHELKSRYKLDGPVDTTLLNNVNIDDTLQQWTIKYKDFFAYNFNMKEYEHYSFRNGRVLHEPDTLATVNWTELYKKGYRTGACVINTDSYMGSGKHWMALFVDCRQTPFSVEFFNSSGNEPAAHWIRWLEKTKKELSQFGEVQLINVTKIRQQQSKTECGVYSLYYIWARLNGISWKYFCKIPVPDQIIVEFRQHLFYDPKQKSHLTEENRFDYDKFKKYIEWEDYN